MVEPGGFHATKDSTQKPQIGLGIGAHARKDCGQGRVEIVRLIALVVGKQHPAARHKPSFAGGKAVQKRVGGRAFSDHVAVRDACAFAGAHAGQRRAVRSQSGIDRRQFKTVFQLGAGKGRKLGTQCAGHIGFDPVSQRCCDLAPVGHRAKPRLFGGGVHETDLVQHGRRAVGMAGWVDYTKAAKLDPAGMQRVAVAVAKGRHHFRLYRTTQRLRRLPTACRQ